MTRRESALPLFWTTTAIAAIVGSFWLFVIYLSQPTFYPNPGLAAYTPPAGTRLIPLLRESDAPELADVPEEPTPPLTAMAQAQLRQKPVKEAPQVRKHPPASPREAEKPTLGYTQQWSGDGNWGSSRAPDSSRLTGGPKSWF
jgi:hypothetical protein